LNEHKITFAAFQQFLLKSKKKLMEQVGSKNGVLLLIP
jgi:hypothetical protein